MDRDLRKRAVALFGRFRGLVALSEHLLNEAKNVEREADDLESDLEGEPKLELVSRMGKMEQAVSEAAAAVSSRTCQLGIDLSECEALTNPSVEVVKAEKMLGGNRRRGR
jgi:hypothetical protein